MTNDKNMTETIGGKVHNSHYVPSTCNCPNCGRNNTLMDTSIVLTSYPAQYNFICRDCGHAWTGFYNVDIGPMLSWPNLEIEEPKYQGETGWICPKCGEVYSPLMTYCMNCTQFKTPTVTCGTGKLTYSFGVDVVDTQLTKNNIWYTVSTQSNEDKIDAWNYYANVISQGETDGN